MTSREAIQARVREKLEREKKLYQEQEAQERAERQKLWAERNEQRQRQKEALQSRRPALDEVARSGVARGRLPTVCFPGSLFFWHYIYLFFCLVVFMIKTLTSPLLITF